MSDIWLPFRTFSLLEIGSKGLSFVSPFDDSADVWAKDDFRILEGLSSIAAGRIRIDSERCCRQRASSIHRLQMAHRRGRSDIQNVPVGHGSADDPALGEHL